MMKTSRRYLAHASHDSDISNKSSPNLEGTSSLEQTRELVHLGLEVGVTADVLLADEDVGDGALVGDLLKSGLNVGAVIY